jgi:hypothetical protein
MALETTESLMEKLKLVRENKYLKERIAKLEEERNIYYINEKVLSYQGDYVDSKALIKEIKHLKQKCAKLKKERTYYINEGCFDDDLFEKYVGLYNKEDNTLFVHHFVDDENIYPYRCHNFKGDYACHTVRGSWDNWNKDYALQKKCLRNSDGIYEGYVYYIIVENIISGNEYEFKFKDADGDWIEPVDEGESDADCNVKLRENTKGIWNAVITVR